MRDLHSQKISSPSKVIEVLVESRGREYRISGNLSFSQKKGPSKGGCIKGAHKGLVFRGGTQVGEKFRKKGL